MALSAKIATDSGLDVDAYVRLIECTVNNHGVASSATFRGYASQAAWEADMAFLWQRTIEFIADVDQPLWPQAYAALKSFDFAADQRALLEDVGVKQVQGNLAMQSSKEGERPALSVDLQALSDQAAKLQAQIDRADALETALAAAKDV